MSTIQSTTNTTMLGVRTSHYCEPDQILSCGVHAYTRNDNASAQKGSGHVRLIHLAHAVDTINNTDKDGLKIIP